MSSQDGRNHAGTPVSAELCKAYRDSTIAAVNAVRGDIALMNATVTKSNDELRRLFKILVGNGEVGVLEQIRDLQEFKEHQEKIQGYAAMGLFRVALFLLGTGVAGGLTAGILREFLKGFIG